MKWPTNIGPTGGFTSTAAQPGPTYGMQKRPRAESRWHLGLAGRRLGAGYRHGFGIDQEPPRKVGPSGGRHALRKVDPSNPTLPTDAEPVNNGWQWTSPVNQINDPTWSGAASIPIYTPPDEVRAAQLPVLVPPSAGAGGLAILAGLGLWLYWRRK